MIQNLAGQRFGKLVVLEHAGFTKNRNARWTCKCDCGNIKIVTAGNLKTGTQSCGCLFREQAGSYKKLEYGEAAFNDLFRRYNDKAVERNLSFELDKAQFRLLTKQVCYYCGIEPHKVHKVNKRVGEYIFNGVDRIDNNKGYVENNIVTCCYNCNRMKHTLGNAEFLTHIQRISTWQQNMGRIV